MRCHRFVWQALVLALALGGGLTARLEAGHTRAGYCDGCQSSNGRFVVTAELDEKAGGKTGNIWTYTWKDTKENKTLTGKLQGLQNTDHFTVTYAHIFVSPDGETFAVFNTAAWAGSDKGPLPHPKGEQAYAADRSAEYRGMPCFADRVVIYKKTGEVIKRLSINDILQPKEWQFIHSVQGNLYWLREYPSNYSKTGNEPPRCGFRYFQVSPDYTVLEMTAGPDAEARNYLKGSGANELIDYKRVIRIRLTDGTFLPADEKITDPNKVPGRPYFGEAIGRSATGLYVPSLDPVRVAGRIDPDKTKK